MTTKIPCSRCEKTFKNASGLSWHSFHIHNETYEADKDSDGSTSSMASEEASPGSQDLPGWAETLVEEVTTGYSQLRDRVEDISQRLEGRLTALRPQLDQGEKRLGTLEANQRDLPQLRETLANLGIEVAGLRQLVNALLQLVWMLDRDYGKGRFLDDILIKQPTKDELREARRVLSDFLGMEPSVINDILAGFERERA